MHMNKVLLSAFRCNPNGISEAYVGFQWLNQIIKFSDVHLVTKIENKYSLQNYYKDKKLETTYIQTRDRLKYFPKVNKAIKMDYFVFDSKLKRLHQEMVNNYDLIHHITPIGIRYASSLSSRSKKFLLGPVGGGVPTPKNFDRIFKREPLIFKIRKLDKIRFFLDYELRKTYQTACKILIIGNYVKEIIPTKYHYKCEVLLENGIYADEYFPSNHIAKKDFIGLLYVGRIVPYKGLELLLHAVGALAKKYPIMLTIIGEGYDMQYCRAISKEMNIEEYVNFVGNLPKNRVIPYFQKCDIFVFPSLREASGNVVLEAMSCGKPVIISDYGGPGEIVKENFGLKIKVKDRNQYINDLILAVESLIKNESKRLKMGRRGREEILNKYDWNVKGEIIKRIYTEIINE